MHQGPAQLANAKLDSSMPDIQPVNLPSKKMATTNILRNLQASKAQTSIPVPFSDTSDSEQENLSTQVISEEYGTGFETEPEDDLNPEEARETLQHEQLVKAGYLLKKQERRKHWKRRWFVLRSTKLAYYKDEKEYELLRILDMNDVHTVVEAKKKGKSNVFAITTYKRTYFIQANDKKEFVEWMDALNKIRNQVQADDDDEASQADSEEMASKQPRITTQKRPSRLAFQEPLKIKTLMTSPKVLEQPITGSPINADPSFSHAAVTFNTNPPSTPSSPSGLNFSPERKDSSDPTASSEDDEGGYGVVHMNGEIITEEGENNRTIHAGYLFKLSNRYKTWRNRWFVLRTNSLSYYKNEKEGEALRVIPLSVILDAIETDQVSKSKRHCFKLITSKRPFIVCAPNEESEAAWLGALQMTLKKAKEKLKEEEDAVKPVIVSPKA